MNDLSEKFMDYMNGGLAPGEEQQLFTTMAYDNALRDEFRSFVAIDNSLKSTSGSFVPPAAATNAVYSGLGLKFPNELAATETPAAIPFYSTKFFAGAMTGLATALIPVVAYLLLFMPKFGDVSTNIQKNIQKAGLSNKTEIPVVESVDNNNSPADAEIKTEIRYVYIDRIIKGDKGLNIDGNINNQVDNKNNNKLNNKIDKNWNGNRNSERQSDKNNVLTNPAVRQANDMASIAPIAYSDSEPARLQMINSGSFAPALLSGRPVETQLQQSFYSSDDNLGLAVEVRGSANWNMPSETLYPKKISEFVNSGIALYYELADWLIVGADVRQETFFVQYNGSDKYGQRFEYEQHPNLTSYGLNLRFTPVEIYKFDPYFNLNFGLNNYGEVARGAFGTEYSLYPDLAFIFELEYSHLFFSHQNTPFNARKIGINYGIKYTF